MAMEAFIDSEIEITEACQKLIDALKVSLIEYKESRPNLSWRSVAKNIRCNRYILSKILNDNGIASTTKTYDMFECFRIASVLIVKNSNHSDKIRSSLSELMSFFMESSLNEASA